MFGVDISGIQPVGDSLLGVHLFPCRPVIHQFQVCGVVINFSKDRDMCHVSTASDQESTCLIGVDPFFCIGVDFANIQHCVLYLGGWWWS